MRDSLYPSIVEANMKAVIEFSTEGQGDIAAIEYLAQTDRQQEFMAGVLDRLLRGHKENGEGEEETQQAGAEKQERALVLTDASLGDLQGCCQGADCPSLLAVDAHASPSALVGHSALIGIPEQPSFGIVSAAMTHLMTGR